jgi:hypothetical protein
MLCYCNAGTGSTDNDMALIYIAYTVSTSKLVISQSSTHLAATNMAPKTTITPAQWHMLQVTRTAISGGNVTFGFQLDGTIITTGSSQTVSGPNTASPTGAHYMNIGGYGSPAGTAPANEMLHADVGDWRLSNKVRSASELQSTYLTGRP